MVSVQFSILAALLGLCYIPARVQSTFPDCVNKVVCNVGSYVSKCCEESPTNLMGMVPCLKKDLLEGMMRECMQSPGAIGGSGMGQQRFGTTPGRYFSPSAKANPFEQLGSSDDTQFMPSQDCQTAMANMPQGVGDCPSWSDAVGGCVKSMLKIQNCESATFGGTGSA